jgi:hypothetical protein
MSKRVRHEPVSRTVAYFDPHCSPGGRTRPWVVLWAPQGCEFHWHQCLTDYDIAGWIMYDWGNVVNPTPDDVKE